MPSLDTVGNYLPVLVTAVGSSLPVLLTTVGSSVPVLATTVGSSLPVLSTIVGSHPYQFLLAAEPALNPTTSHLLHGDLFRAPAAPFRGDSSLLRSWRTSLERKIMEFGLDACDIMMFWKLTVQGKHRRSFRLSR